MASLIRLGLYSADPDVRRIHWVDKPLSDTPRNRDLCRLTIDEFNRMAGVDSDIKHCLGVFEVTRQGRRKRLAK